VSIEERIAKILRRHKLFEFSWGVENACTCGHDDGPHSEHVASALVAELGLTQEIHDYRYWVFCRYVTSWRRWNARRLVP
jgi:hypothetical protein